MDFELVLDDGLPLNITECVLVPSSEHVAEIVGKQGCKIKALRNKTGTYIKTPERGCQPVFTITGRKEDVEKAKRNIVESAENFNMIRASRLKGLSLGHVKNEEISLFLSNDEEYFTYQFLVPSEVVGLIVGPKGATIKRIQEDTRTYIVTPGRDCVPIFYITGSVMNIKQACQEIENYIYMRLIKMSSFKECSNILVEESLLSSTNNAPLILTPVEHSSNRHIVSCSSGSISDISSLSSPYLSDATSKSLCLICRRGEGMFVMWPCFHGKYCLNCSRCILARPKEVICPDPTCRKPISDIISDKAF